MTRTCTICRHPSRESIELALVAGDSIRDIAGHAAISKSALARHKDQHLSASVLLKEDEHQARRARSLLEAAEDLLIKASKLLQTAEESGDIRTAITGVREARGCLELLSRLQPQPKQISAEEEDWAAVKGVLVDELRAFPDISRRIADRLRSLEETHEGLEGVLVSE